MDPKLEELKARLQEAHDLSAAAEVLNWDQNTYMPPGGAAARARQSALLGWLAHEKLTAPAIGQLLDDLRPLEESLPYDDDDASFIRVARRQYERLTKVPAAFMGQFFSHTAESYSVWVKARPENNFAAVRPYLEKTLDLSRQLADYFPGYEHIADPLIDFADYGMKVSTVRAVFAELREHLVPLIHAIMAQPPADDSCLHRTFPQAQQAAFFDQIIRAFGFDFERGRCDISPHPFTTGFSIDDVRITVRYQEDDLGGALFSALHEAGHAMYEQGCNPAYEATPLAGGASSGIHESQSRLWENIVGRSRGFWMHYYPQLQTIFPAQLGDVPPDTFYRAINKVQPSLIRTDADEVTYNLHVMLRFDFELALLEGNLAVRDLPEAWHERFKADLGIAPPDDRDGVLQDVHWYGGVIGGAFQGYTLGNILSAQFYHSALEAHPEIPLQIAQGEFGTLHSWLKDNIYTYGSKYTAPELIERVTGGPLRVEPYIAYLRNKYGELYAGL
ncbi:MAG TPA: carboxypeptidase M32 [Anaerolineae bacterium]|nr:carboxypeptidase M32 [Anaerolineae bacterium]HQH38871.1 carboxypeptidase M32 [Anaerolineae bacterium]